LAGSTGESLARHQRHSGTQKGQPLRLFWPAGKLVEVPRCRSASLAGVPWLVAAVPVAILTIFYKLAKVRAARSSGQARPWAY
jgi:hypothetical protein